MKDPLYIYLRSHVDLGCTAFLLKAKAKPYIDGVEFTLTPERKEGIAHIKGNFEVSSDPEDPDFDFLFNVEAVPEPDVEKFKILMRRANLRDGLDEMGKPLDLHTD